MNSTNPSANKQATDEKHVADNKWQDEKAKRLSLHEQMVNFIVDSKKLLTMNDTVNDLNDKFTSIVRAPENSDKEPMDVEQLEDELLKRLFKEEENEEQSKQLNPFLINNLYNALDALKPRKKQSCPIRNNDDWNFMFGVKLITKGRFVDSIAAYHYININRDDANTTNPYIPGIGRLLKRDVLRINEGYEQSLSEYRSDTFKAVMSVGVVLTMIGILLSTLFPPLIIPIGVSLFVGSLVAAFYVANKKTEKVRAEGREAADAFFHKSHTQEGANNDKVTVAPRKPTSSANPAPSHDGPSNSSTHASTSESVVVPPIVVPKQPSLSRLGLFAIVEGSETSGQPDSALSPKTSTPKANGNIVIT